MPPTKASASAIHRLVRMPPGAAAAAKGALPSSRRAPSGSTMRGTSRSGALNSTIGVALPQTAPLPPWATATPCSAAGAWASGQQTQAQRIAARRGVQFVQRGLDQLFGEGKNFDRRQHRAGRARVVGFQRQQQVTAAALQLGRPALQRLGACRGGALEQRRPGGRARRRAGGHHRQQQLQRGALGDAHIVADQPVGLGAQAQIGAGPGVGRRGQAHRQQQLAFVAVVDQRADRQAAWAPAIRSRRPTRPRAAASRCWSAARNRPGCASRCATAGCAKAAGRSAGCRRAAPRCARPPARP